MSTATEERVEVIVDVDLNATVRCTTSQKPCGREAVWAFAHGCGNELTACDRHREQMDRLVRVWSLTGSFAACYFCDAPLPTPIPWRAL